MELVGRVREIWRREDERKEKENWQDPENMVIGVREVPREFKFPGTWDLALP